MNLLELKQAVDRAVEGNIDASQISVEIKVERVGAVGGTPSQLLKTAYLGFDWDRGKFLLYPETALREIDRDEIKKLRENYDELGWKLYQIQNLKRENAKLKQEINELRSKGKA